jgi:tRNA pseudouridine55 synthase
MNPILLHKLVGQTPLEALEQYRAAHPELAGMPMTYAGRLDPMASGLLLVLAGDDCKQKDTLNALPKTYQAQILFGVGSDSFDVLGIPTISDAPLPSQAQIDEAISALVGTHQLQPPIYSSIPYQGKPLFTWAQTGRLTQAEVPTRPMTITEATFESCELTTMGALLNEIESRIELVQGDFRQQAILQAWRAIPSSTPVAIAHTTFSVTSGTYIRSIAQHLGETLQTRALLFSLHRSSIGPFK